MSPDSPSVHRRRILVIIAGILGLFVGLPMLLIALPEPPDEPSPAAAYALCAQRYRIQYDGLVTPVLPDHDDPEVTITTGARAVFIESVAHGDERELWTCNAVYLGDERYQIEVLVTNE